MPHPCYIDLKQARTVLAEYGINLNERQMQRAAEKEPFGRRKLPFFVDPIDKRLKIEKSTLVSLYLDRQQAAEKAFLSPEFD